jgi:hypothetical protein
MASALLLDYRTRRFEDIKNPLNEIIANLNLSGFCKLRIFIHAEKNVALEERKQKKKDFKSAVKEWSQAKFKNADFADVFYDVYGTPTGPCEDWFKNMWLTFQDTDIDRIAYLPYDIVYIEPPVKPGVADTRLQEFIDTINNENIDLLLGTYECAVNLDKEKVSVTLESLPKEIQFPDSVRNKINYDAEKQKLIFKGVMAESERKELLSLSEETAYQQAVDKLFQKFQNNFLIPHEKLEKILEEIPEPKKDEVRRDIRKNIWKNFLEDFTILELWTMFPNSMAWFCQKRDDPEHKPKPRTGFFGLSRCLFKEFVKHRSTMSPWAGTVQLLICAAMLSRKGPTSYRVAEQFVTELKEPPGSFTHYRVAHQRKRIAYVIANEAAYWNRKFPDVPL